MMGKMMGKTPAGWPDRSAEIGYIPVPRRGLGLAGQERFELSTFGFGDRCSAN